MKVRRRILVWSATLVALLAVLVVRLFVAHVAGDALVSTDGLAILWGLANLAGLALAVRGLDSAAGQPLPAEAKVLGLLLVFPFVWAGLEASPPSLSLFALLLSLLGTALARRPGGRPLGGAMLGAGALVEPALLLVLPWLLYRGRLRTAAGWLLVVGGGLVVAWSVGGVAGLRRVALDEGLPSLVLGGAAGGVPAEGLPETLRRAGETFLATGAHPLALGIAALVFAGLLVLSWLRQPGLHMSLVSNEVGAAFAASVALAPRVSSLEDFVLLLPSAVVGWEAWRQSSLRPLRGSGALLWGAALAFSLVTFVELTAALPPFLREFPWPLACAGALLLLNVLPGFFPTARRAEPEEREAPGKE